MTIQEMKAKKIEYGYSNNFLAKLSGVPVGTLQKIFSGETAHPRYETICALERVLSVDRPSLIQRQEQQAGGCIVRETAAVYGVTTQKKQGEYTLDDYYALPEDQRAELIDGVLYDMTAPATFHQLFAGEMHRQIANYILGKQGACVPLIAPTDVQLDCDEKTMVEPDVAIVCDRDKIVRRCVYGAPDFIAEVISPSTKRKDYTTKLMKYMHAGVREYWLVDPYQRMIFVYFFEEESSCPAIYPFDAEVPVHIYDGDLKISLARMVQWLPDES